MTSKKIAEEIAKLENRVHALERKFEVGSKKPAASALQQLKDRVKQHRYQQQKQTQGILSRTYGKLSKKRADEITKQVNSSRKAWK